MLFDALGTLVSLAPPAPRLRAGLRDALGVRVGLEEADRVMRAEIAYYRDHLHEAADLAGLADLRIRCATIVRDGLELEAPIDSVLEVLLDALRFEAYPDAAPALRALRADGVVLVVVSNWDVSLHEVLERTGLGPLVDGAVSSAEVGAAKPDPEIFTRALALAGARAGETWHVGDTVEADVEGARRAGILPVLIDRAHGADASLPPGVRRIASLVALLRPV